MPNEAPERIWAFYAPEIADHEDGATIVAHETVQHGAQPYRRDDLPRPEDAQRIAELKAVMRAVRGNLDKMTAVDLTDAYRMEDAIEMIDAALRGAAND